MENSINEKINNMTDIELVKAIAIEKADYQKEFLEAATVELQKRNVNLQEFISNVTFEFNMKDKMILKVSESIEKITEDITIWQTLHFTNCFGDSIVFRKESFCWSLFFIKDRNIETPFFIESIEEAKEVLSAFLNFANWREIVEDNSEIDDWISIRENLSHEQCYAFLNLLEKNEIPASGILRGEILIPKELLEDANSVIDERINFLYEEIEKLSDINQPEKEVELLMELNEFLPEDSDVAFNLGVTFFELGHFDKAADTFIELAQHAQKNNELISDIKSYLIKCKENSPNNFIVNNALAQFYNFIEKDHTKAIEYYQMILNNEPTEELLTAKKEIDSVAHLSLGNIYYEMEKDKEALEHFNKYLELNPNAPDKEEIEELINQIKKQLRETC